MMESALQAVHKMARWTNWLAVGALALMMSLTAFDVTLRYFGSAIPGTYDIVRLLCLVAIAIPIAHTQSTGGHITINFFVEKFPGKVRLSIGVFKYMINILAFALLSWQTVLYGTRLLHTSRVSESIKIPLFPFAYILGFAFSLQVLVLTMQLIELLKKGTVEWEP